MHDASDNTDGVGKKPIESTTYETNVTVVPTFDLGEVESRLPEAEVNIRNTTDGVELTINHLFGEEFLWFPHSEATDMADVVTACDR